MGVNASGKPDLQQAPSRARGVGAGCLVEPSHDVRRVTGRDGPLPLDEPSGLWVHELDVEADEVASRARLHQPHLGGPECGLEGGVQRNRLVDDVRADLVGKAHRMGGVRAAELERLVSRERGRQPQIVEQARHVQRFGIRRQPRMDGYRCCDGPRPLAMAPQMVIVGLGRQRLRAPDQARVGRGPRVGLQRCRAANADALEGAPPPLTQLEPRKASGGAQDGTRGKGGSHVRNLAHGFDVCYDLVATISAKQELAVSQRIVDVWLRHGVTLLDVTGPIEVLATATQVLEAQGKPGGYRIRTRSPGGEPVRTSAGLTLTPDADTTGLLTEATAEDTLLLPGAYADASTDGEPDLLDTIARFPGRVLSVCAGSFRLAQAGRLDGRRATTHWLFTRRLARRFPKVEVEPDALWTRDGTTWTSAGVSAGIDLTLGLVEADLGRSLALHVARLLVLYLKRPGGQSQFSAVLSGQKAEASPLSELLVWMHDHPAADQRVPTLARRVGMSPRHFARVFVREVGETPAARVRRIRLSVARRMLEDDGRASLDEVAQRSGFGSLEALRRAFVNELGVPPGAYRNRFATP